MIELVNNKDVFELAINFEKGGDPGRVFRSMSDLLDVLQLIDQTLCEMLGLKIRHSLQLEEVQQDCFKSIVRNVIDELPDRDLRNKNDIDAISYFLVEAKYSLLEWCEKNQQLSSDKQIETLEKKLVKIAELSTINKIPAYQSPNRSKLLKNINALRKATRRLTVNDTAEFVCFYGSVNIYAGIEISDLVFNEFLVKQIVKKRQPALLQVKRPDYLGQAKWLLKFQGYSVDVLILDELWLQKFQQKEILVHPGDSLRGVLLQHVAFGYDMEIVSIRYELEIIEEVVAAPGAVQSGFDI